MHIKYQRNSIKNVKKKEKCKHYAAAEWWITSKCKETMEMMLKRRKNQWIFNLKLNIITEMECNGNLNFNGNITSDKRYTLNDTKREWNGIQFL